MVTILDFQRLGFQQFLYGGYLLHSDGQKWVIDFMTLSGEKHSSKFETFLKAMNWINKRIEMRMPVIPYEYWEKL